MSNAVRRTLGSMCLCAVLVACGGGGGDGDASPVPDATSPPTTPGPNPAAVVEVEITSPAIDEEVVDGDIYSAVLEGTWGASNLGDAEVYLQVSDTGSAFAMPPVQLAPADPSFHYALPLVAELVPGERRGELSIRACADQLCTEPYAGTLHTVGYTLHVIEVAEWETLQGNAAHTGYVPVRIGLEAPAITWRWPDIPDDTSLRPIHPVVTDRGAVYVSTPTYFSTGTLFALDERTGTVAWSQDFPSAPALNPPAVAGSQVYLTTTGHEDTYLWSFDTASGDFVFRAPFTTQWQEVLAPTIYEDEVYTSGGYYGDVTYAFDRFNGDVLWSATGGYEAQTTPAVGEHHVYHYTGTHLLVFDRATGALLDSIADPAGSTMGYGYDAAPVIGSRGNVLAYSGLGHGREGRLLSSYDIEAGQWEWASGRGYDTLPALADGVVYAASSDHLSLDAIDENNGDVLWSWSPGPSQGDTGFHHNVIVTKDVLFVSTDRAVYAIDLATRKAVWRHPEPGWMTLSADRTLYIATGAEESNGRLVALRLQR